MMILEGGYHLSFLVCSEKNAETHQASLVHFHPAIMKLLLQNQV